MVSHSTLTRRELVCRGAVTACALAAGVGCGGGITAPIESTAIEITDDAVVIRLAATPELVRAGGHVVVRTASIIVLNLGADGFRAFSNVCTHAGCGVDRFERGRMICPCHGSEYDTNGVNVAGPAPEPLRRLALDHDTGRALLRVERR